MAFAGAMDLLTMTIPNRISLLLIGSFAVAAPLAGFSWEMLFNHVAVGVAVLAVGIAMFSMGWVGGGDAKLMAAAALWIGADNFVVYFAQVTLFGGLLAVAILMYRRLPIPPLSAPQWALKLHNKTSGIPYGIAIAAAALKLYPQTIWFSAFTA